MSTSFDELWEFTKECFEKAEAVATAIALNAESQRKAAAAQMIGDLPRFANFDNFYGATAWAAILSVDLRGSSRRAVKLGARGTYLTMHTYLPVMAKLVGKADGIVIGLRGDGLFAAFGFEEVEPGETAGGSGQAVQDASFCAHEMIESVKQVINPILRLNRIQELDDDLQVGVGIAAGRIVVTRIGFEGVGETTAYGPAVNKACKLSNGHDQIKISRTANSLFPTSVNGRVTVTANDDDSFIVNYPLDFPVLPRRRSALVLG